MKRMLHWNSNIRFIIRWCWEFYFIKDKVRGLTGSSTTKLNKLFSSNSHHVRVYHKSNAFEWPCFIYTYNQRSSRRRWLQKHVGWRVFLKRRNFSLLIYKNDRRNRASILQETNDDSIFMRAAHSLTAQSLRFVLI